MREGILTFLVSKGPRLERVDWTAYLRRLGVRYGEDFERIEDELGEAGGNPADPKTGVHATGIGRES